MKFKKFFKLLKHTDSALLAILIDPDKYNEALIKIADQCKVNCILVGGSVLKKNNLEETILSIKKITKIPVVLFPGDENQLNKNADGLFLPSLLSGRNPDYLIEKQILMAPKIKAMQLPHAAMAYLLLQGENISSTQMVTNTQPLEKNNHQKIINTAISAEQLGFKVLYLEAGSGAKKTVSPEIVRKVKSNIKLPLIVGGGINSVQKTKAAINAGASMVVVGNALEKNPKLLLQISKCFNQKIKK